MVLFVLIFKGTGKDQSTLFSNLLKSSIEETSASIIIISQSQNQLADINSLAALNGQDSGQGGQDANSLDPSTVQGISLQASSPADTDYINGFQSDQVVKYTVQPGDSIGSIASKFDDSIDTLVWANNLTNPNELKLGQILRIPPVSGVIHTVRTGDTVASIAKKYKADSGKILSFNKLQGDQDLVAGNDLMVPDGQMAGPKPSIKPSLARGSTDDSHGIYVSTKDGQCVSFVQAHGYSKFRGNAKDWVKYIKADTNYPQVGGVVIFAAGRSYGRWGHVALITAVKDGSIQVVEQNFYGRRVIDHREVSLSDKAIAGFIQ